MKRVNVLVLLILLLAAPAAARGLEIFFIDVEGGQATLIVTPAGQSLLIDAGYGRSSRDPERIMAAAREAGIERIDYLLITHFHGDHVGGVPELALRIPIGTFVDYGSPLGTSYGADRMSVRGFSTYEPVRSQGRHLLPQPGDRLPLTGVAADVVSSGGALLSKPLAGGGQTNDGCVMLEDHPEDGTENFRSLGIVLRYGAFSFVDLGDLSGNTLLKLVCPRNLLGEASVYLIAHHGDYDADAPAVYTALKPRVAVMNNGATKGGDPAAFRTVHAQPGLDLWQLQASRREGAKNAPDDFIANVDDDGSAGHWIKLTANEDGSFSIVNGRNGFTKTYPPNIETRPSLMGADRPVTDPAWDIVLAASALAEELERQERPAACGLDADGRLRSLALDGRDAVIAWSPQTGWQSRLPPDDQRSPLLDLYLPVCGSTSARPLTVGHLGQSLDGFIAAHSGDSQFVTGSDNLVHLHRMRALCGVVVVGAGTVAADDPQLTTRYVPGPNPLRVVFDPTRRLASTYRVFTDDAAPTLYFCERSRIGPGERHMGNAVIVGLDDAGPERDVAQVLSLLRARGCARVFVEGGGVTVSAFLEANLLDRLHIAIAPILIGDGRPAIRLAPRASLRDCCRPAYRVFRMGGDVLFDCELNAQASMADGAVAGIPGVARVI